MNVCCTVVQLFDHVKQGESQLTELTQGPQSMNVTLGEVATFNCSGVGRNLNWTVDGVDVHQMTTEMIEVLGISVVTMKEMFPFPDYTFNSFVNITANCLSNRTVRCIIYSCYSSVYVTSSGFLQVEGTIMSLHVAIILIY